MMSMGGYVTEFSNYRTVDGKVFNKKEDAEKYVEQLTSLDILVVSSSSMNDEMCFMVDKEMSKEALHSALEVLFGPEKVLDDTMWESEGPITLDGDTERYVHLSKIVSFLLSDKESSESFEYLCGINRLAFIGKYEIKDAYSATIDGIIANTYNII